MLHKAWSSIEEVPYCFVRSSVKFQGHTALKFVECDPDSACVTPDVMYGGVNSTDFTFCRRTVFVGSSGEYIFKLFNCCSVLVIAPICCDRIRKGDICHFAFTSRERSLLATLQEFGGIIWTLFQGHPSNYKVTRLKISSILTQIERFRTVTPVCIHQWLRNDAQSLK